MKSDFQSTELTLLKVTEYKIYKPRRKAIKLLLISFLFVACGVFLLNQPNSPKPILWICIPFLGVGIPLGLFEFFDRRPQLIFNEIGLFDRTLHKDFINWEIIADAYPQTFLGKSFVCLVIKGNFDLSGSKNRFVPKVAKMYASLGFQELTISLGNVNMDAEKLIEFILAMSKTNKPNRKTVMQNFIAFSKST